ncbi:hypothetical protein [Terrarubrum flagellatum]|uniref:hypothetical protein n=1 Tax=Terrirubrum flagellatum TaxID=2895980 RepID=UPI003145216C
MTRLLKLSARRNGVAARAATIPRADRLMALASGASVLGLLGLWVAKGAEAMLHLVRMI